MTPAALRRFGALVYATLAVTALVVVVAQFDPGRLVHLQPLRGSTKLLLAVVTLTLLVAVAASWLATDHHRKGSWLLAGTATASVLAVCMGCASPLTTRQIDFSKDHAVSVVAVAPDRSFEVISATRRDDSGGSYGILRARSRDGLLSRNAAGPLAWLCGAGVVEVTFAGATELKVRTQDGTEATVTVHRRTLSPSKPFSTCD